MVEIRIPRQIVRLLVQRRIRTLMGFVLVLTLLWGAWGNLQTASAEPPWPTSPVGTRIQLPILSFVGNDATSRTLIQVQNVGSDFTRAIMLGWGAAGPCTPQAIGPFKIECSGIIKPGATWIFSGQHVAAGAKSGIIYTFPQADFVNDEGHTVNVADEFCERLLGDVALDAGEWRRFDIAFREGDSFFDLPTTGGQPVAVDVLRVGPGTPSPDLNVSGAYAGLSGADVGAFDPVFGGFAYHVPIVYADAEGLTSWLYIQNAGVDSTTVELWFQEQGECLRAEIFDIPCLAAGETASFDVSQAVGPGFVGSVWIRTSQPSGVIVDHLGQNVLMTDKAVAARNAAFESGGEVLFGPLIYREFQGWETSVTVQNLSATRFGAVKVYFYDESGNIITTLVDYVCPRGTRSFFLPVINGLPGHYVGAVRVESLTTFQNASGESRFVPIAGVAHLRKYTDPASSSIQEAISYNLLGESQTFDWQLGPGNAGLIGVPSVLKQGRGLSTEIAIQNVNPNPGFTDFAIYLYDANGLLEVVCEKLSAYNVEYINFDSWGILNPGFVGSVIISGVFTNQPGGFGLSAVAIQRVQSILQFGAPGDESSGHEAFPIFVEDFDFEGPSAPACPGLGAGCTTNLTIALLDGGEPLANTAVQLRSTDAQGGPIATGTTNATGQVQFAGVPVKPGAKTTYQIWYFVEAGSGSGEWVRSDQDLVIDLTGTAVCPSTLSGSTVVVSSPVWISQAEIQRLPMSGPAWQNLKGTADSDAGTPDLSDKDDDTNVAIMAKALVYARTDEERYRDDVEDALEVVTYENTEDGGRTLALGRELAAYIISADLINLASHNPALDADFRDRLRELLTKILDGRTLQSTHEDRPNNWGTHNGASRAAIAVYLGDDAEIQRTAQVFKGWLGDRSSYSGFEYGDDLSWQCDPDRPVGINPSGCAKEGHDIGGAMPEAMRRGGSFQWPPGETIYAWEALQGALVQAEILYRAGYPTWEWEDRALLRAAQFLYDLDQEFGNWWADGDDEWQVWLINRRYGTEFPSELPARPGKNAGWTDWTHSPIAPSTTTNVLQARQSLRRRH